MDRFPPPFAFLFLDLVASRSYHFYMRAVGLKVLKNRLSEYVRLVAGGETVLITDRDRVVAELVPPAEGRSQTVNDVALAALVRQGCLTPPLVGPGGDVPRRPVLNLDALLQELGHDRADR
jgi:antitoxin (DNA-binding transcriptional repressor) of toxin-antitoxin stability system